LNHFLDLGHSGNRQKKTMARNQELSQLNGYIISPQLISRYKTSFIEVIGDELYL